MRKSQPTSCRKVLIYAEKKKVLSNLIKNKRFYPEVKRPIVTPTGLALVKRFHSDGLLFFFKEHVAEKE